MGYQTGQLLN